MITATTTIMATGRAIADMHTESCTLSRLRARGPSLWAVLWLVAGLLLAQHAGLVHRVLHGGLPNASPPARTAHRANPMSSAGWPPFDATSMS